MPDSMTKEKRSALMSRIHATNTGTERTVFRLLRRQEVYFARHAKDLPGSPDVVFRKCKLAVFIDGDFWHGRNFTRWSAGLSPFWSAKIRKNMVRDRRTRAILRAEGWSILKLWSKDVDRDPERHIQRILRARAHRLRSPHVN